MEKKQLNLQECLKAAKEFHGGQCAGITIGTRMAILGMEAIGIEDPMGKDKKDLMVFVEIDRCATDAILAVTGCHPGKRTMKIFDYGKMAATFVNLKTGKAVRIAGKNRDKDKPPEGSSAEEYERLPAEELFDIREVIVSVKPEDMPGRPIASTICSSCGEKIMDMREVIRDGRTFCRPCAESRCYYVPV